MSVQATCFHCQHPNSFPDKWAGKIMRCQKCGGILTLPRLDGTAAPQADLAQISQTRTAPSAAAFPPARPQPAMRPSAPITPQSPAAYRSAAPAPAPAEVPCSPGTCALATTLCTVNGLVMLLTAAAAAAIAVPATRGKVLDQFHIATISSSVPQMAWGLAAITAILGVFYIFCATQMRRTPTFARAAVWGAMGQTALQIAMLIYMTMQGQLNNITLAVLTLSLIVLCALIDLSTRAVRIPRTLEPAVA